MEAPEVADREVTGYGGPALVPAFGRRGSLARGSILMTAGRLVAVAVGYALNVFLARRLGPSQFGTVAAVISVLVWLELVVAQGLPLWLAREIDARGDAPLISRTYVLIQLGVSLFLAAALFACAPLLARAFQQPADVLLFRLAAVDIPIFGLYNLVLATTLGAEAFGLQSLTSAAYGVLKLVATIVLVSVGLPLTGVVLGTIVASAGGLVAALLAALRALPGRPLFAGRQPAVEAGGGAAGRAAKGSAASAVLLILQSLALSVDLWIVTALLSSSEAGTYRAAALVAQVPIVLSSGLVWALYAAHSNVQRAGDTARQRHYVTQATRLLAAFGGLWVALVAPTAGALLVTVYSGSYASSAVPLALLAAGTGLGILGIGLAPVLLQQRRGRQVVLAALGIVTAEVVFAIAAVPRYGSRGIALCVAVAFAASSVIVLRAVRRYLTVRVVPMLLRCLAPAAFVGVVAFATHPQPGASLLAWYLGLSAAYAGLLFMTGGLTAEDLAAVHAVFARRRTAPATSLARLAAPAAIVLAGLAMRVLTVGTRGLWYDEAITIQQASLSVPDIVRTIGSGVHPPLFHVLVHLWLAVFGQSEIGLRSFSVVVGTLSVAVAYWAGLRLYDRKTALVACTLVAVSPYLVWYSQEGRMYGLLFLTALLSVAFLALALRTGRGIHWAGYVASTLLGLFVHYFFLFLLAGEVAYYVLGVVPTGERKDTLRRWLASNAVLLAVFGSWAAYSVVLQNASTKPSPSLVPTLTGAGLGYGHGTAQVALRFNDLAAVLVQAVAGFHSPAAMERLVAAWPVIIFAALLLLHTAKPVGRTTALLLACMTMGLIMMLLGQWQAQILVSRYFLAVAAPAFLLAARVTARLRGKLLPLTLAAVVLLSVVAWADQSYDPENVMRYDNREALRNLDAAWRPGDVALYVPYYLGPLTSFYLPPSVPAVGIPTLDANDVPRVTGPQIDYDLTRLVGSSGRVWLFFSFQDIGRIRSDRRGVEAWLKERGYRVAHYEAMNKVVLERFDKPDVLPKAEPFFLPSVSAEAGSPGAGVP